MRGRDGRSNFGRRPGPVSNLCQIPELCQISLLSQILVRVKFGPCGGPPPCQIFGRAPPPHPVSNFGRAPGPDVKFWPSSGPRSQILAKPLGRPPGCVKFFESCQNSGTRRALSCQIFFGHTRAMHVVDGGKKLSLTFCSQTPPLSFYTSFCKKVQRT